jgi:acyl carrier protein
MDPILSKIQRLLQEQFKLTADQVRPDQCLADQDIDSLSAIEFLFKLEDEFDISLSDERGDFRTVADIAGIVEKALSAKAAAT